MPCTCDKYSTSIEIPLGNSFFMGLVYEDNEVQQVLPEGYNMLVGIWDLNNNLVKSATTEDGSISLGEDGKYRVFINHQTSMKMTKVCNVEITILSADHTIVKHAMNVVAIKTTIRNNNAFV